MSPGTHCPRPRRATPAAHNPRARPAKRAAGAEPGGSPASASRAKPPAAARLNLWLRTASRVLVRLGSVKALAFPELVKKARELPFELCLRRGSGALPVALRVTCRKSRLYHSDAVAERIHAAIEARLGAK